VSEPRAGEEPSAPDSDAEAGYPQPGEVLRRLRQQRGLSLRAVADEADLSPSFLGALERGETDIALGRLARLARIFDHDVGSFLGFSARRAHPQFLGQEHRIAVDRGEGVGYDVIRIPGMGFDLTVAEFAPGARFRDERVHEGVDIILVTQGTLVAVYNHEEYELAAGACVTWSGGYPHTFRNDGTAPAQLVGVVTATVH
jgi:transcriptional regulator with XRE-family HTH domain